MLIELPAFWIIVLNIAIWLGLQLAISFLSLYIPDRWLAKTEKGFRSQKWEREGEFWEKVFHVRAWKKYLPDGSASFKKGYSKDSLRGRDSDHLEKFIVETKRGELAHWLQMLPAPIFFIWNPPWASLVIVIYSLLANLPCIITQRYNRPRLERIARLKKNHLEMDDYS